MSFSGPQTASFPVPHTPSFAIPVPHTPPHNEKLLDRAMLHTILNDFSARLLSTFGRQVRLVIHGGAVMILHPYLKSSRVSTRDVDYISRSFVQEWRALGVHDAQARLESCIAATAEKYRLGADWMNAHADVALPMAADPATGRQYDPIYQASVKENNIKMNTVYRSAGLELVAVAWYWAVALKMVRYDKNDPDDICAMLRHGTRLNGVQWQEHVLEGWLLTECWPMGYANYPSFQVEKMREKIRHAVQQAYSQPAYVNAYHAQPISYPHVPRTHRVK